MRRGQSREALHAPLDDVAHIRQTGVARPRLLTVCPGQPEQIFDDSTQPGALPAHPFEHLPVGRRIAGPLECQSHLGLNDRDGRAQLVRGIGGEIGLPATDELRRRGGPQTHNRRTSEHGDSQDHSEDELGH